MVEPTSLSVPPHDPWRPRPSRPQRRAAVDAATAWQTSVHPKRHRTEPAAEASLVPYAPINDPSYRDLVAITGRFAKGLTARRATERFWDYVDEVEALFCVQGEGYVQRMFAQPDLAALSLKQLEIVRCARSEHDPCGLSGSDSRTDKFNNNIATLFPKSIADRNSGAAVEALRALAERHARVQKRVRQQFAAPR